MAGKAFRFVRIGMLFDNPCRIGIIADREARDFLLYRMVVSRVFTYSSYHTPTGDLGTYCFPRPAGTRFPAGSSYLAGRLTTTSSSAL